MESGTTIHSYEEVGPETTLGPTRPTYTQLISDDDTDPNTKNDGDLRSSEILRSIPGQSDGVQAVKNIEYQFW